MNASEAARQARVARLLAGARRLADPGDSLGKLARARLPTSTGLSPAGVEYALTHCLETAPTAADLARLHAAVSPVGRAHVLLSANVFVAAHRAIALALSAAPAVEVRASRREPEMAMLLQQATGGLFRLVDELDPNPSEHVWAYGRDETLRDLRHTLPAGVVLHAHGDGLGVAVVDARTPCAEGELTAWAQALAHDVVAFDQRGCLSPRLALLVGDEAAARAFARQLARGLAELEERVPRGETSPEERGAQRWHQETLRYVGEVFPAGRGAVTLDLVGERATVSPGGRVLPVVRCDEPAPLLRVLAPAIAAVGLAGSPPLWAMARDVVPRARSSSVGRMQRPPLDGPVDQRPALDGERL